MYLGAHVSIAESIALAPERGAAVGCEAIQIFSRSPRMLRRTKPLPPEDAEAFRANLAAHGIRAAVIHDNYLINLASPKAPMRRMSREAFREELERAQLLGIREVIFHPGAHMGKGEPAGLRRIAEGLDACMERADAPDVMPCLENTAGQGTTLGHTLEQLADVIEASSHADRLGMCVDTCHTFAAGYDIRTRDGYEDFLRRVDATVGLRRVRAFHLNDSKGDLGSHLDRHEDIGKGRIGTDLFAFLVNDARFRVVPGCLEYPGTDGGYRKNLKTLRALVTTDATAKVRPKRARRGR